MPLPVLGRRGQRRSPPELVFGFSPEGRRREEAFYLSLDGNAENEDLLEHNRRGGAGVVGARPPGEGAAYRRFVSPAEQQRTDALSREQSARNWADYVEAGARQIALEAVGHAGVRDADFYYHLVKWVSRLEAKALIDHASMERANMREQRVLSHLWQVRGEAENTGAGV